MGLGDINVDLPEADFWPGIIFGLPVTWEQFWGEPMNRLLVWVSRELSLHVLDGGQPISGWHQVRGIGIAPMMSACIRL